MREKQRERETGGEKRSEKQTARKTQEFEKGFREGRDLLQAVPNDEPPVRPPAPRGFMFLSDIAR